jgi:hypothetical protein
MGGFMEHDKQKRMDHPSAEPYLHRVTMTNTKIKKTMEISGLCLGWNKTFL